MSADQQLALARATRGGESSHLSKAAQKVVPPFLQKLYEIVNDPKNDALIRWSDSGDSFYVLNHERLSREVLGRWFKHQKFTSFVRQLNMYGFHKIPHLQQGVLKSETDTEPWHFEHPHFHRGQPDLLCLIQRKKQPPHSGNDESQLDIHDHNGAPTSPIANLTAGQILDINSIMNGISAIKRHQQAISADLNELKSSNQHLWQEALAARERHKKHQDTINRILKFLAGVFGNTAEPVKHDGPHDGTNGIHRQRQRLLIGDAIRADKRKSVVEEVEDDEDRQSVRSDQPSTPTGRFVSIDTPDTTVHSPSPNSPGITPNDPYGPSITDITSSFRSSMPPPVRPTEASSRASSEVSKNSATAATSSLPTTSQLPSVTDDTMSPTALMNVLGAQNGQSADWSAALRSMFNSPSAMQQLMHAFASQQNHPVLHPASPKPDASPDHRISFQQLTPYDPSNTYDLSRLHTDMPPPPIVNGNASSSQAPLLGPLMPKDDGPALEPLVENADRLQKTYHDAAEIDADVDALQFSLNSLIHNLGLDPGNIASATPQDGSTTPSHDMADSGGTADFDFDAFLNELSSRNPTENGTFSGLAHFEPPHLDGSHIDASTDQLTAFMDDVSDTASMHNEPRELAAAAGMKRKSDVSDLPPPLVSNDTSILAPRVKRKR